MREDLIQVGSNLPAQANTFLATYNPDMQSAVAQAPMRVFADNAPALVQALHSYGRTTMVSWLTLQLARIAQGFPADRRPNAYELNLMSEDILNEPQFRTLKVTEIMLFLSQYRTGKFGKVYGYLNSINLCVALREFLEYKSDSMDRIESRKRQAEREKHEAEAITYEEYCRRTGLPEQPIIKQFFSHEQEGRARGAECSQILHKDGEQR